MTRDGRRPVRFLGALLGLIVGSCSPEPLAVLSGLEIVIAEGDGQFGTIGQTLGTPLRVVVRSDVTLVPQEAVAVQWEVESGGATLVTGTVATTDETGSVEARVRLGPAPAEVAVRATVVNQPSATVLFSLHTVDPPELLGVSPTVGAAGDTVTVTGSNFSPVPEQNVVLFSGIRAAVAEASEGQLTVEVPACLPARNVEVSVQLGVVASDTEPFTVTGGGVVTPMAIGEVLDVADDSGFACHALSGAGGAEYLGIVYSAGTVGAAMHPFELTGLSSAVAPVAAPLLLESFARSAEGRQANDAHIQWDERVRRREEQLVAHERSRMRVGPGLAPAQSGPTAVPTVGERRAFNVWVGANDFEEVSAVAQYVGGEVAIFVDEDAPDGGFNLSDLEEFAGRFDEVIHPEITSLFGTPSDLDQNERVIVLFSPVVNGLTPRGSSGFVGGFFFGNDLLPDNEGSNEGEVFYALVPDPVGIHSDPRTRKTVLNVVPAVLAHEFQHMVQFNQRFLGLDAGQEALWLAEALAQMAEEAVARRYDELGDSQTADMFRAGARARAGHYLTDTEAVSLIVSTGQGTLAERGAGFLFLLYLADQEGTDLLGRLSTTTRTGVANVEAELGREWPETIADWWSATFLDGPGPESGVLAYPSIDLREYLGAPFPLVPELLGPGTVARSGLLWSSSVAYYRLAPDPSGSTSVRLGGEAGGPSSPQAGLRLRIIRIS